MTEQGPRGSYAKSAVRRRAIVQAARESFLDNGVENASLRDIARRAGITHAGLLHHFAGKDELIVAVIEERDQEEDRRSRVAPDPGAGAGAGDSAGDSAERTVRDRTASFLRELLAEHRRDPQLMRLWAELTTAASRADHPAHEYFVRRYETGRALTAQALRNWQSEGLLRPEVDADRVAALLAAVLDGLQTQWLLDPERPIDAELDQFLSLLFRPDA